MMTFTATIPIGTRPILVPSTGIYNGMTRPHLTEILAAVKGDPSKILNPNEFREAWRVAGVPTPSQSQDRVWEYSESSKISAYVAPNRTPFLPFGTRSGWELLARLERYGCKIGHYDLMSEHDLIEECLAFMESEKFKRRLNEQ